ncbi:MAG: immunoglobulin-like domain-containing protein [Patescibacteria group bacterium]
MSSKPLARLVASFLIGAFFLTAAPTAVFADTTSTLTPSGQGTYTSWTGDESGIDETGTASCGTTDGNENVSESTTGDRESVIIDLSSVSDGASITSVEVFVSYRDGDSFGSSGTFQTFTRLNGSNLDSGSNIAGSSSTCLSASQVLNVADTVKSGATTLEVGVLKTATDSSEVWVGSIRAVVTYEFDTTAPTVVSINRSGTNPTGLASVSWNVTFSETVTGVDAADFVLVNGGLGGSPTISGVTGSGAGPYVVTASSGSGNGTLGLSLVDDDTIVDGSANILGGIGAGNGDSTGQVYDIDKDVPSVTIEQADTQADPTPDSPINFTVNFSEPVIGFSGSDITVGGSTTGTKTAVVTGSNPYNVAISGMTSSGTVIPTVNVGGASDFAGNGNTVSTSADNSVQYDMPTFDILSSANAGGTISPLGITTYNIGQNAIYTSTPSAGNILRSITVDGGGVGAVQTHTFTAVNAIHTIVALFEDGWNAPSATSDTDNDVGDDAEAFSSNNLSTDLDDDNDDIDYLNFNVSIPTGATVDGIEVAFEGSRETSRTLRASLSWNNGANFTSTQTLSFSTIEQTLTLGGSTDTWGRTWTAGELANANFRLRLLTGTESGDINLDQVQVKVYYTPDTTAPAGGSITYTDGYVTALSVPLTYTLGTDAGAGLNNATGRIQRAAAPLSGGTCGTFDSFFDVFFEVDGSQVDSTVTNGNCYQYQYVIADNVGNEAAFSSANVVKVDTQVPVSSIDAAQDGNAVAINLGGGTLTTSNSINFSFSATDAESGVAFSECRLDAGTYAPCSPALVSYSSIPDGVHTVYVRSTDNAGNIESTATLSWTIDSAAPVVTVPSDVSIEATSASGAPHTFASSAEDAVQGAITPVCAPASGSTFVLGPTLVTCTATDDAGNIGSASFTVTVTDLTAPIITLTGSDPINLGTGDTYDEQGATASDIVDGDFAATVGGDPVNTAVPGTYVVSYSATDNAGNTATPITRTVNVVDDDAPVITLTGADPINLGTGDTYTELGATALDNIDGSFAASIGGDSVNTAVPNTYIVTYDAVDAAGNHSIQVTRSVIVADDDAPVIDAHGDESAEATSVSGAAVSYTAPNAVDNVDATFAATCLPASGSTFAVGDTVVTCNASDAALNAATPTTFTVSVLDTTIPVIDAHGDETAEATSASGAVVAYTPPNAIDIVDGSVPATCAPISGSTFAIGTTPVLCDYTDAHGNVAAQTTFNVIVSDSVAPVIDAHGNETAEATSALGAIVTYTAPNAVDAVDGSVPATCAPVSGSTFVIGTTPVLCDHTDTNGNAAAQTTFDVVVTDLTAPVISLIGSNPINLGTGDTYTEEGATASDIVDGDFAATVGGDSVSTALPGTYIVTYDAVDAHGNNAVQVTRSVIVADDDAPVITLTGVTPVNLGTGDTYIEDGAVALDSVDGSFAATIGGDAVNTAVPGTYIVTYNASDLAGNAAVEVTRTVNVVDDDAPIIDPHGDESAEATSVSGATVSYTAPNAVDNVDGTFAATCLPASGSTFALGDTVVTCDAVDSNSNNATQTTFTVHVVDTTGPVITLTGSDPVNLGTGDTYTEEGAVASDAVDGSFAATIGGDAVNTAAPGTYVVSYSAVDVAGNIATPVTRTVHVVDDNAPIVTVPADITAEATSASGATVPFIVSASDDVDGALAPICDFNSGDTFPLGPTLVTCIATDSATNVGTASFTITIEDTTVPVIDAHADESAEATSASGAVVTYTAPNAIDIVDGTVPATCLPASGSTFAIGSTPVLCNYTDAHGNAAAQTSFTAMVTDNGAPVIDAHGDETAEATSALGTNVTYTAPNANDTVDGTFAATCLPASGTMFAIGDTVVTCNATDSNLNAATPVPFTVHVVDTTAPVITLVGVTPVELTVGDAYLEQGATTADAVDGDSTAVVGGDAVNTGVVGTYIVTYNKTDLTGNIALEITRSVIVSEAPAPIITVEDAGSPTETSIVVTWTTDHPATSRVVYDTVSHDPAGAAPNYDYAFTTLEDANLVTSHSVTVTGLTPGTSYYFRGVSHGSPESISSEITETTLTPAPTDVCPNIDGAQSEVPEGYQIVEGQCVEIPPATDVCPNIEGDQATVPEGYQLVEGECVVIPPPPTDVCPNIDGVQSEVPEGYEIVEGQCVLIPPPPAIATVVATKIICNEESDLPNWGDGAANISASTAIDFLATHPNCHPQEDWQFEWAPNGTPNPGSNLLGPAGGAWTTTGVTDGNGVATVVIPASTGKTWIREVLEAGYILFSDWVGGPLTSDDEYSAEMYCNTDVLNYDNYDWILNPAGGATYYCVAFNAVPPTTGTLIVDKVTNPEGDNTSFHFDASFDEEGFDLADGSEPFEVELPIGNYSVSEDPTEGWTLADATCVDGEGDYFSPSDITVSWGDTVTCTFTNAQDEPEEEFGKLVVIKRTRGGNDTFDFSVSNDAVSDFSITTHHRYGVKVLKDVPVGEYTVDEAPEAGWLETRNTCEDVTVTAGHTSYCVIVNKKVQTPPTTDVCPNIEGEQATVPAGHTTTDGQCVLLPPPAPKGAIIVTKTTIGGDASFTFTPSYSGSFTLMNGESHNSGLIDVGNYMVSENPVDGWIQTSATCVSSNEDIEAPGNLVLQAGETITCSFVNTNDAAEEDDDEEEEETGGGNGGPSGNSNPPGTGGGGGNGNPFMFGLGGANPIGSVAGTSTGQVLGVSCGVYMDKHLRLGSKRNNAEQVLKLQKFLNKWMDAKLPETGFYGPQSAAAIKAFQAKYADEVLTPWGEARPTGFVYLTTLRKINMLECPGLSIPSPILIPWSANPNAQ